MKLIAALLVSLFACSAHAEASLRGSDIISGEINDIISEDTPHERRLQIVRSVCSLLSAQIDRLECSCDFDRASFALSYTCVRSTPVCIPDIPLVGQYCATPSYDGVITLGSGFRNLNSTTQVCAAESTLTGSVLGDVTFEDLCVEVDSCFTLGSGSVPVCGCSATYGGVGCSVCEPCNDGRGTQITCDGLAPICIPLALPGLGGRTAKIDPFVPELQTAP